MQKVKMLKNQIKIFPLSIFIFFVFLSFYYKDLFYILPAFLALFLGYIKFPKLDVLSIKQKNKKIAMPLFRDIFKKQKKLNKKVTISYKGNLFFSLIFTGYFYAINRYFLEGFSDINALVGIFKSYSNLFSSKPYLVLIPTLLVLWVLFIKKEQSFLNRVVLTFISIITSLLISLFLLFFTAAIQINYIPIQIKNSKDVELKLDEIVSRLKDHNILPQIVNGKDNFYEAIKIAFNSDQRNGELFYYKNIFSFIDDKVSFIKFNEDSKVVLVKDSLIFKEITKEEIQDLSPIIGNLFVKSYLEDRYVKDLPDVEVLGRQEYLRYREDTFNEQISEIKDLYSEVSDAISTLYSQRSSYQVSINNANSQINSAISSQESAYSYCMTAGYYSYFYLVRFNRYYSDAECLATKAKWDQVIQQHRNNISVLNSNISIVNSQISDLEEVNDYLEGYISIIESQKDQTVYELGVFIPEEKKIKIALDFTSSSTLADYFSTLVHEYFHYTSYVSDEKQLPQFFEEGLTEYFARKSIKQELDVSTELGYPVLIKVMDLIVGGIGEESLKDIYLNKNTDLLISLLNDKYGDTFYDDSEIYFTLLPYLPAMDQVDIANNLIVRMGGDQITIEDVMSKGSEL